MRNLARLLSLALLVVLVGCSPKSSPRSPAANDRSLDSPGKDSRVKLGSGWTRLPAPPEARSGAATAWTGSKLLVWGGYVYTGSSDKSPKNAGYVFDARSGSWASLPSSPLAARSSPAVAWTGSELLVWGGFDGTWSHGKPGTYRDGAAYDPKSDQWRMLPRAPLSPRVPLSVWTERELIVWGTGFQVKNQRPRDGAAYDPRSDSWRRIASAPIELTDATAVWTGREMIVFGAALRRGRIPETDSAIGAAYDPRKDSWRIIPDSGLSPGADAAAWDGREMVAWDAQHGSAAYDPRRDRWRPLQDVPLGESECVPESIGVNGHIFGNYCGFLVLFDRGDDRWHEVTRRKLAASVLEPISAGQAFLILVNDYEHERKSMLAFRPSD
ncbi:MAG: hypothetical protein WD757_00885 [Actinomycetota bacterium]